MRAWWQQGEDSKTYQGMVQLVIFKLSLKLELDNNGHMAQLSESEIMKQSTSGAGGVENPEQLNFIFSCLGSSWNNFFIEINQTWFRKIQ